MNRVQGSHLISIRSELKGLEKSITVTIGISEEKFENQINVLLFSVFSMSEVLLLYQNTNGVFFSLWPSKASTEKCILEHLELEKN